MFISSLLVNTNLHTVHQLQKIQDNADDHPSSNTQRSSFRECHYDTFLYSSVLLKFVLQFLVNFGSCVHSVCKTQHTMATVEEQKPRESLSEKVKKIFNGVVTEVE